MDQSERPPAWDRLIAGLAGRQYGVVALWQLAELGLTLHAVQSRLKSGRLHQIRVGVYAVGHTVLSRHGRWLAAVLAYGPAAVLSHRDAAALWGIRRNNRPSIDVTADRYTRNARPGIDVHRPRRFDPVDATACHGIPVTTVAKTLIDLAAVVSLQQLTRAWDEAIRLRIFNLKQLEDVRARSRGRRGLKHIDLLVAQSRPLPPRTNSDLELDALDLIRQTDGIPEPSGVNVWIADAAAEVDFVWEDQKAIVEIDGPHHLEPRQRDEDNARDARLQLAEYRILRISDRRLAHDRDGVKKDLKDLLRGGGTA